MRSPRPLLLPLASASAVLGLALAGCGLTEEGSEAQAAGDEATRVVATDQGEVTIPADPQRVVVLNHALAGYFFHLDVPVAATIPETVDGEGGYSEFWAEEAEAAGTEILPWSSDGFDFEAILATEPDLIVGGGVGFP